MNRGARSAIASARRRVAATAPALIALACSASPAGAKGPVGPSVFYNVTDQGAATFTVTAGTPARMRAASTDRSI